MITSSVCFADRNTVSRNRIDSCRSVDGDRNFLGRRSLITAFSCSEFTVVIEDLLCRIFADLVRCLDLKVLAGLGIPGVGKATAKELIRTFGSIDAIAGADRESLVAVQDIGEISAEGIYNFFHDEGNKELMERLKDLGLNFAREEREVQGTALAGLTFCITGTLEGMSRSEAESLIESNGGKPVSSVSKKTSYLLMGADAGSKERKARELGVPIIGLEELKDMIAKG